MCGEKLTKLYALSEADHKEAIELLLQCSTDESAFTKAYPLSLEETSLSDEISPPVFVHSEKNDDGVGAVFSSVVELVTRETIEIPDTILKAEPAIASYDEIVGLKRKKVQTFHTVWVPHNHHHLEIRTDHPPGMTSDLAHGIHASIRSVVNTLCKLKLETPIDLAPLIESMYESPSEGRVVELGFVTTTGSVKNEKMRTKGTDLRTETYHKYGKAALPTKIEPFRLSLRWTLQISGSTLTPELSLVGTSKGRYASSGDYVAVSAATIKNCVGIADYEFVTGRLLEHLKKLEKLAQKGRKN
jgi:hypothetical protein